MFPSKKALQSLLSCSFVIVDKPRGPSSHEVSSWVKKILGANKSGHCGTLDPQVSGVLPVGIGKATRLLPYLTKRDKRYVCLMKTGEKVTEKKIKAIFRQFTGTITQTPPKQSAVAKKPRKRKVYYIKLIQIKPNRVLFEVHCEAGTYVRVLVSEFGRFCGKAEMLELRRISVGGMPEQSSHMLQKISDAMWLAKEKGDESRIRELLIPPEKALGIPKVVIAGSAVGALCAGSALYAPGLVSFDMGIKKNGKVAFMTEIGEFIGVGCAEIPSEEMKERKKGAIAKPETTIMEQGKYPKSWK